MGRNSVTITNTDLRRLWLDVNGLAAPPSGPLDVMGTIRALGFLQIDTVRNVARAQDHILWSRNRHYRETMLWPLLRKRLLFEHFTHDASLIPMEIYPLWQRQFHRLGEKATCTSWYQSGLAQAEIIAILARIEAEGPLSTHAFDTKRHSTEMWARPPHKKALEQMWYAGVLATAERRNFVKFYDLGARIFPSLPADGPDAKAAGDRLCDLALDRLALASTGEIKRFWDAVTLDDVRDWARRRNFVVARVQAADGSWYNSWAAADIAQRITALPSLSSQIRILNPFDPAIRDRKRLKRIFGFEYRNEMFVPQVRRRWGYYVYPLLEGGRFVGRVEAKGARATGRFRVTGFWPEAGVRWGARRTARLQAELDRFARLAGLAAEPFWPQI